MEEKEEIKPTVSRALVALSSIWVAQAAARTVKCAPDAMKVSNVCIDKYEASVWQIPVTNTR